MIFNGSEIDKKEFLEDMFLYYGVNPPERRAKNEHGGCVYNPVRYGQVQSEGCGIGRHCAGYSDVLYYDGGVHELIMEESHYELPNWINEQNQEFLEDIQTFHDNDLNWDEYSLSPFGKVAAKEIIRKFKINIDMKKLSRTLLIKKIKEEKGKIDISFIKTNGKRRWLYCRPKRNGEDLVINEFGYMLVEADGGLKNIDTRTIYAVRNSKKQKFTV